MRLMLARSQSRFHQVRLRLEAHVPTSPLRARLWEFGLFVFKQGWACLFGAALLTLVLLTKFFYPPHAALARYDFLFLAALALQILLLAMRMETLREAKVVFLFHVVGTVMELFKTHAGSWTYPEPNLLRIAGVPLFSGFMYASVGSYLARASRILDMRYTRYPSQRWTLLLAALIYANFFTHHFFPDIRSLLFASIAVLFGPTTVYFRAYRRYRHMPLVLGFLFVACFVFLAENIGTFASIWLYPNQQAGWHHVDFSKYGSWLLLMIISFILVTLAHRPAPPPLEVEVEAKAPTPLPAVS